MDKTYIAEFGSDSSRDFKCELIVECITPGCVFKIECDSLKRAHFEIENHLTEEDEFGDRHNSDHRLKITPIYVLNYDY